MDDRYSHNEGGGVEDHYFGILFFLLRVILLIGQGEHGQKTLDSELTT